MKIVLLILLVALAIVQIVKLAFWLESIITSKAPVASKTHVSPKASVASNSSNSSDDSEDSAASENSCASESTVTAKTPAPKIPVSSDNSSASKNTVTAETPAPGTPALETPECDEYPSYFYENSSGSEDSVTSEDNTYFELDASDDPYTYLEDTADPYAGYEPHELADVLISSKAKLRDFLLSIPDECTLYIHLDGHRVGRHGTVSTMALHVAPQDATWVIDVQTLQKEAFTTPAANGKTLKSVLEDANVPKAAWDVRRDADALWALYDVTLAGVTDVQLLENAARDDDKTFLYGLRECVASELDLGAAQLHRWAMVRRGTNLLRPSGIIAKRPMDPMTLEYCIGDVVHLPALKDAYEAIISNYWLYLAREESEDRVEFAQCDSYDPSREIDMTPWLKPERFWSPPSNTWN